MWPCHMMKILPPALEIRNSITSFIEKSEGYQDEYSKFVQIIIRN